MDSEAARHKVKAVKKARNKMRKAKKAVIAWKSLSPKADLVRPNKVNGFTVWFGVVSEDKLTRGSLSIGSAFKVQDQEGALT
jgi:hypothetical protein